MQVVGDDHAAEALTRERPRSRLQIGHDPRRADKPPTPVLDRGIPVDGGDWMPAGREPPAVAPTAAGHIEYPGAAWNQRAPALDPDRRGNIAGVRAIGRRKTHGAGRNCSVTRRMTAALSASSVSIMGTISGSER